MKAIWVTIFDEGNTNFYLAGAFDNQEAANACAQNDISDALGKVYKFDDSNIESIYTIENW